MGGRVALDTNVVVQLFGEDASVKAKVAAAAEVLVSVVVLGELYYGAEKSGRRRANIKRVDDFAAANTVLPCDGETARQFGRIKDALRAKGRPIPENDMWIAASAVQHNLILATRDAHFDAVDGLDVERW